MKCPVCKLGTTKTGKSTLTVDIKGHLFFFKDVPASVCNNCGEVYFSSAISKQVYQTALESIKKGSEFEIIRLTKVAWPIHFAAKYYFIDSPGNKSVMYTTDMMVINGSFIFYVPLILLRSGLKKLKPLGHG